MDDEAGPVDEDGVANLSNVTVVVRLRPPDKASDEDVSDIFSATNSTVTLSDPLSRGRSEHTFNFSRVFLPEHGQDQVFQAVARPLINHLLKGFNSCCFAYGQTGSGKTHSVFGEGNAEQRGMLARSIEYLFEKIEQISGSKEVGMAVSFTEVYLDQIRDLGRFYADMHGLRDGPSDGADAGSAPSMVKKRTVRADGRRSLPDVDQYLSQDLQIHESPQGLVYVENLSLIPVSNIREVLEVANLGIKMRATYETRLNARSSRSHTIFTVSIAQRPRGMEGGIIASAVNFVDLAGSERLARSQSEGRRFQEAVVINTSLSALGKVVLALASNHRSHIPYRDTKLTRILQNSLGGNSYTTLLTTIDPSPRNYEESLNSLLFADRCKNVQNRPMQGAVSDASHEERTVQRLLTEVADLQRKLEATRSPSRGRQPPSFSPRSLATQVARRQRSTGDPQEQGVPGSAQQPRQRYAGDVFASSLAQSPDLRTGPGTAGHAAARATSGDDGPEGSSHAELLAAQALAAASAGDAGVAEAAGMPRPAGGSAQPTGATLAAGPTRHKPPHGWVDGKTTALVNQAVDRLQKDKLQTREARNRVQAAAEAVDEMWRAHYERDDAQRKRACHLRKRNKELETELAKHRRALEHFVDSDLPGLELEALRQGSVDAVRGRAEILDTLPPEVCKDPMDSAELGRRVADRIDAMRERHWEAFNAVQDGLRSDADMIEQQSRQLFREREAKHQRLRQLLDERRSSWRRAKEACEADLVAAHGLAMEFSQKVDLLIAGVPAQSAPMGVRPLAMPSIAAGATDGLSHERAAEQLRSYVHDLKRQVARAQRPEARQDARLPLAAAATAPLQTALSQEGRSSSRRLLSSGDNVWDARAFARDFCASGCGEATAGVALEHLGTDRLYALCLALFERTQFAPQAFDMERRDLRDSVARDLGSHQRVDQIRQLERDIATYKARLDDELEKTHLMSSCLRGRRCSSTSAGCRSATSDDASAAASGRPRSGHRPGAPSHRGSSAGRRSSASLGAASRWSVA